MQQAVISEFLPVSEEKLLFSQRVLHLKRFQNKTKSHTNVAAFGEIPGSAIKWGDFLKQGRGGGFTGALQMGPILWILCFEFLGASEWQKTGVLREASEPSCVVQ